MGKPNFKINPVKVTDEDLFHAAQFTETDPFCPECDNQYKEETGCRKCINQETDWAERFFNLDNNGRY